MRSGYKIIWSAESKRNIPDIIIYLETKFSDREIQNFFRKFEKIISLIKKHPNIFRVINRNSRIRKCVMSKQVSLYYRVDLNEIYVISVFDNRRNPASLSFETDE